MALRITSRDHTAHKVTGIPIGSGSGSSPNVRQLIDTDAGGWSNTATHTIFILWYCEEPGTDSHEGVICEFADASGTGIEIRYKATTGTQWEFVVLIGGTAATFTELLVNGGAPTKLQSNPSGKWVAISLSYQKITDAATSRYFFTHWILGEGTIRPTNYIAAGRTTPVVTELNLGKNKSALVSASAGNARGIPLIYFLRNVIITDGNAGILAGSVIPEVITDFVYARQSDHYDLAGPIARNPVNCSAAFNVFEQGKTWFGGSDSRPGTSDVTVAWFDRNQTSFPNYLAVATSGPSFTGTVPHVDPYTVSGLTPPPADLRRTSNSSASLFFNSRPWTTRKPGGKLRDLLRRWRGTSVPTSHLVVGICGNSRAVFPSTMAQLLPDGTRPGRTVMMNFVDAGFTSHFWNGGLSGMANFPPPDATGRAAWGMDCNLSEPLTRTYAGVTSSLASAVTDMIETNYTRAWTNSRAGTTVGGVAHRFRGPGRPLRINVGFGMRGMVRPETGIPVTDGLRVRAYLLNCPSLSNFEYRKEVTATAQNGANVTSDSYVSVTGNRATAQNLTIGATSAAVFTTDTVVGTPGTITVNNTGGYLTANHVGQWAEVLDGSGALQDLVYIQAINNSTPSSCVVTYEGGLKNTVVPGTSTLLVNPSIVARYRTVEVTFAANEVSSNQWRGLDIRVPTGAAGAGVQLLAYDWRNTTAFGICPAHIGRNGCGTEYQFTRLCHTDSPTLGTSAFDEMMQTLGLDIFVCMTADQGNDYSQGATQFTKVGTTWVLPSLPLCEMVYAVNGPEFVLQGSANYLETDSKPTYHQCMRVAADAVPGAVFASWYLHQDGCSAFNRYVRGWTGESEIHPPGGDDWRIWFEQLEELDASGSGSGGGGRLRLGL